MKRRRQQSGFTLIELIIAITLVAAISAGLLTTMRNGLLTMERTQQRMQENRRALGVQDLIRRQIGGAMPVKGLCGPIELAGMREIFRGTDRTLLFVSNESMTEGSRGHPQIALYAVRENPDGTVRLEVTEQLFAGPASTRPFCEANPMIVHPPENVAPVVLLDHLSYARFVYRELNQNTLFGREFMQTWVAPLLPYSVRIELEAAPGSEVRMPVGSITIPLHVLREPGVLYFDEY